MVNTGIQPILISSDDESGSDPGISFIGPSRPRNVITGKRPLDAVLVETDSDSDDDRIPDLHEALAIRPPVISTVTARSNSLIKVGRSKSLSKTEERVRKKKDSLTNAAPAAGAREDPWESSQALCRQEREEQRRREKEAKQLEKDRSKAEKEAQRSFQKKVAEVNRLRTSKNDAVREIEVHFSADLETPSSLIAGALPEIKTRLDDNLCKWFFDSREDSPHPGLIRFRRHVRARWDNTTKRFYPLDQPRWEWDKSVLVLSSADDLVDMISQGGDYLNTWMADLRMIAGLSADTQIILIIKGLEKYYSKTKTLANREYTAAARAGLQPGSISTQNATITRIERDAVVAALLELQFAEKAYIVKVEKTEDIEDWIWNLAADIAVRPYKLLSKSHLSFAPPEHLRKATNSTDALELMLQEVLGITPSAASGIAAKYPTFAELMTAFERAEARGGLAKAEALLADCEIKNLRNGTASGRKLNKALAKKVYQAFRGEDSLALA